MATAHAFPSSFLWGTATAAFQIEGSPLADGASPSIWYHFAHRRGKIRNGDRADAACDHYHRFPEDIGHMAELGLSSYRFSISWSRILPSAGTINQKGLDFYNRLVDLLLEKNIRPMVTLFHWDTPQWLEDQGGFVSRTACDHARDYAEVVFRSLGDRVKLWVTLNEPLAYAINGYIFGNFAPGRRFSRKGFFHVTHHLLLTHARMVQTAASFIPDADIGIANAQIWMMPAREGNERDLKAADAADALLNRLYVDPLFRGSYPDSVLRFGRKFLPANFEDDLPSMKEPGSFFGLNYYTSMCNHYSAFTPYIHVRETHIPGARRSAMWQIWPKGLLLLLRRLKDEYGNPQCFITENGYPFPDSKNGRSSPRMPRTEDNERIAYLRDHLASLAQAMEEGVHCRGYYLWSLMDNFEWDHGYYMRFGLIDVDFQSLTRTWRKSAYWYREVIRSGGIPDTP